MISASAVSLTRATLTSTSVHVQMTIMRKALSIDCRPKKMLHMMVSISLQVPAGSR
jgi:hypothetical protein